MSRAVTQLVPSNGLISYNKGEQRSPRPFRINPLLWLNLAIFIPIPHRGIYIITSHSGENSDGKVNKPFITLLCQFDTWWRNFWYFNKNKDHQRMMVDPMFMIVKNLRLFLTAVTLTAVTPTAVIL